MHGDVGRERHRLGRRRIVTSLRAPAEGTASISRICASTRPCSTWSREPMSPGRTETRMTHVVVGVGDSWGDPGISLMQGDTVSYRFDQDGVYPVRLLIHPGMVGAIVVGRRGRKRTWQASSLLRRPKTAPPPRPRSTPRRSPRTGPATSSSCGSQERRCWSPGCAALSRSWSGTGGREPSPARPSATGSGTRRSRSCPPAATRA